MYIYLYIHIYLFIIYPGNTRESESAIKMATECLDMYRVLVLVLVLQAPNKILYESYKVLHASYKEVWLFLGRNIVFQLATERTIFFSKQSQVCLEVIY
jgi:hypothetical protein